MGEGIVLAIVLGEGSRARRGLSRPRVVRRPCRIQIGLASSVYPRSHVKQLASAYRPRRCEVTAQRSGELTISARRLAEPELEKKARYAGLRHKSASVTPIREQSVLARQGSAAMRECQSRATPCWRKSGSSRQAQSHRSVGQERPAAVLVSSVIDRQRLRAAALNRRHAYGRRKQPSETRAQIVPPACMHRRSSGTNSLP